MLIIVKPHAELHVIVADLHHTIRCSRLWRTAFAPQLNNYDIGKQPLLHNKVIKTLASSFSAKYNV